MADWASVLTGEASAEDAQALIAKAVADLDAFLKADPRRESNIFRLFDRNVVDRPTPRSWQILWDSVVRYLGKDVGNFVIWAVAPQQTERVADIERRGSSPGASLIRALVSIYGVALERTFDVWNRSLEDWETVTRDLFFDQFAQKHVIRIGIIKYDGGKLSIEGNPDSILTLTSGIIATLRLVGTADAFSSNLVESFFEQVTEFQAIVRPETSPATEQPEKASTT